MLWNENYKDYERDMMLKYDEIQKRFEAGAITMEEYDEELNNNLPNPADEYYSAKLQGIDTIHFSFTNNPFVKLIKSQRKFSTRCALFDSQGKLLKIVNQHDKDSEVASYRYAEGYLHAQGADGDNMTIEEEVIKFRFNKMKEANVKYGLIYLWAKDVDLLTLEDTKIA
jgi:hypothetical protein